ncbi:MAG: histidine triad nucleotide-binding protein [Buchnera aphidicola (Brevicoryne brassicae)]|uniref:Histidine triad nucleotide-binding protein n=1 Tax=Buchnera aphidicola (Brevicoryne brassicae) TaxID=911343 RepID=A0AAJ5TXE5_9GAMM|nr:histidine triad nucleotide-binding protein [Buchnera aphidicola]QCI19917.1 histidine triad nucleotide-binding protein [Buchnera aphidicola (Brevicoryne brassicae)]WAI18740.1 MAG: histidine triad nucleotide-binding protein [Buchnera aphidicola (Brevicoryne brassicae)]
MSNDSIFKKIIEKKIPANIIYEDEIVTAFKDIKPKAPIHILVIPNILIASSNDINKKNKDILGHMFYVAVNIAKQKKINKEGYRIIVNCNKNAGQEINYLHMHLLGGKKLNAL